MPCPWVRRGPPGEVTQATLDGTVLGPLNSSSNTSNGVGTLDSSFQASELELLRGKLNELILALRR